MSEKKFEIGDKVSVLDDNMNGVVIAINNKEITIETTDGFTMTYFVNELVKENNSKELEYFKQSEALHKIKIDTTLTRKQKELKNQFEKVEKGVPEFDLHIEKLVNNFKGMSNFDILTLQVETAQKHIEFALRNRIPKIVMIHGVGDGVLKSELDFLYRKYPTLTQQVANYQKYGLGATELYFKQNLNN